MLAPSRGGPPGGLRCQRLQSCGARPPRCRSLYGHRPLVRRQVGHRHGRSAQCQPVPSAGRRFGRRHGAGPSRQHDHLQPCPSYHGPGRGPCSRTRARIPCCKTYRRTCRMTWIHTASRRTCRRPRMNSPSSPSSCCHRLLRCTILSSRCRLSSCPKTSTSNQPAATTCRLPNCRRPFCYRRLCSFPCPCPCPSCPCRPHNLSLTRSSRRGTC
mmetsp:Transcript_117899/g.333455  ORF Transcript_117899/g.333455 Transcript_117899/m.333455 type:complete len:213 (+) Transcript_117899:357-995(+)